MPKDARQRARHSFWWLVETPAAPAASMEEMSSRLLRSPPARTGLLKAPTLTSATFPTRRLCHLARYGFFAVLRNTPIALNSHRDRARGWEEREERHEHKVCGHTPRDRHRRRPPGERRLLRGRSRFAAGEKDRELR